MEDKGKGNDTIFGGGNASQLESAMNGEEMLTGRQGYDMQ